jgi:hypothetical protein
VEIGSYGNIVHQLVGYKTFSRNSNVLQVPQEDEMGQHMYEVISYDVLYYFIPKELLHMKTTVQNTS